MPSARNDVMEKICELAHRLWCVSMEAEGWRLGPEYDADRKMHPDICAYVEIAPLRRRFINDCIKHDRIDQQLIEAVDSAMAWDEWTLDEIRPGLRVQYQDEGQPPGALGRILDWKVIMPEGDRIESFRVQWDDGSIDVYEPSARYIRAVGGS